MGYMEVVLIDELINNLTSARRTVVVCESKKVADNWIKNSGGNPAITLSDGSIEPLYRVNSYNVLTLLNN